MGVNNLWQVLRPLGRRVGIDALEGKILAIDVSIWLVQFVKAMRDSSGRPIENSHILGSFRRLLKLIFSKVRPVFVFDGAAPILKRRTLMARAQKRKKATTSVQETARALLRNQIQQYILREEKAKQQEQQKQPATPPVPHFNHMPDPHRSPDRTRERDVGVVVALDQGSSDKEDEEDEEEDDDVGTSSFKRKRSRRNRTSAAQRKVKTARETGYAVFSSSDEEEEEETNIDSTKSNRKNKSKRKKKESSWSESDSDDDRHRREEEYDVHYTGRAEDFDFDSLPSLPVPTQVKVLESLERR
jgi:DNA excision repair protein ERCC-5